MTESVSLASDSASAISLIPAGNTGDFNDIAALIITNSTATATTVSLSDNGSGGNVYQFDLAPYGGIVINFSERLRQTAAAAAWEVLNSAGVLLHYVATFVRRI